MKKLGQKDIVLGDMYEFPILSSSGQIMLKAGEQIDENNYSMLIDNMPLYLLDDQIEKKTPFPKDFLLAADKKMRQIAFDVIRNKKLSSDNIKYFYSFLEKALEILKRRETHYLSFLDEENDETDFLVNHGVNSSLLMLSYGVINNEKDSQILNMSLAALLHDLGHIKSKNLQKMIKDPKNEIIGQEYIHHPHTGYEMLKDLNLPPLVLQGILFHHERIDGNGYPTNLPWKKLPIVPKIISMIDVLEMYLRFEGASDLGFSNAIIQMINQIDARFDAALLHRFLNLIRTYIDFNDQIDFTGYIVRTNIGEWAIIKEETNLFLRPDIEVVVDERNTILKRTISISLTYDSSRYIVKILPRKKSDEFKKYLDSHKNDEVENLFQKYL